MPRTSSALPRPRTAFIPALRHEALTPAYDFFIRLTMPEVRFRQELIDVAAIDTGQRVLDVGCGTGTLLAMIAERHPDALLAGVDPDPQVLQRAQRKIAQSGHSVALRQGSATALPYAAESFDLVVSSLVFHHLTCGEKLQAMREIHRVLAPGGELHLGDFGEPDSRAMRVVSFLTEKIGREHVADNFAGMLMPMLEAAGFTMVEETGRLRSIFGVLRTIRAFKARTRRSQESDS